MFPVAGGHRAAFEKPNDLGEPGEKMGGSGSGWQSAKKATVEDSLSLSMVALMRKRALVSGSWTRGSWVWSYEGSEPHARIGYEANLIDPDAA